MTRLIITKPGYKGTLIITKKPPIVPIRDKKKPNRRGKFAARDKFKDFIRNKT